MKRLFFILTGVIIASTASGADGPCVIPGRGYFRIHTGTAGLFGAFAHDHLIEAQKIDGCATMDPNDLVRSSIKLSFTTANIRVTDPKESAEDRSKIQKTMETEVLRISEYSRVMFESTEIERAGGLDQLRVRGNLTVRGKTQSIIVPLTLTRLNDGDYRAVGEYRFKQTSFGIQPIQLAAGTIKVKDELRAEFELFLK